MSVENGVQTWQISSWLETPSDRMLLARFKWIGETNPLANQKFYSFVEDWDRCENATGCDHRRSAHFINPTLGNGDTTFATSMEDFTHVKDGLDAFACGRVEQTCCNDQKTEVCLTTGGAAK